jgi:hypothetical protein
MPKYQAQNVMLGGTQRDADTNFMGALPRAVRRYAVDSDRCQDQGEQPECPDKGSSDALAKAGKLIA